MLMTKWNKICGILLMSMLCACSGEDTPTNINVAQNQSGQNEFPISQNAELIFSSSSIAQIVKKSKFEPVETQYFMANSKGELYLYLEIKYSDYDIVSDSMETYKYTQSQYNENGSELLHTTAVVSQYGLKTISNSETEYYDYSTGIQTISRKSLTESESSTDEDVNWTTYLSSKSTSIVDAERTESIYTQSVTKEFLGKSEKGREYILHHIYDGKESGNTHVYVDDDGFVTEASVYNSDNSLSGAYLYTRMPNAPESILKSSPCRKMVVAENSSYEYYNFSCENVVNTMDDYKLIVKETYKYKSKDQVHTQESHYAFKRFEY